MIPHEQYGHMLLFMATSVFGHKQQLSGIVIVLAIPNGHKDSKIPTTVSG